MELCEGKIRQFEEYYYKHLKEHHPFHLELKYLDFTLKHQKL